MRAEGSSLLSLTRHTAAYIEAVKHLDGASPSKPRIEHVDRFSSLSSINARCSIRLSCLHYSEQLVLHCMGLHST